MPQYEEEKKQYDVPKAAGKAGYFKVLDVLFDMKRVQEIRIVPGCIAYTRFRKSDEPENTVDVDLESVLPFSVIRSHPITELKPASEVAAIVVAQMFARAQMDGYNPVAFASGTEQAFRQWHAHTTKIVIPSGEAYGIPFLVDLNLPVEALFMCAAFDRKASLVDTVHSYKVTLPRRAYERTK